MFAKMINSSKMVLFVLTCMTFLLGSVSYLSYYNRENNIVESEFKSIKKQFSLGIKREIENRKNCLSTMVTYFETMYPNASNWPNVAVPVPMDTYKRLSDPLQDISRFRSITLLPFVKPNEIKSFENVTYSYFKDEGKDLGMSDFGKGIFTYDEDGERVREIDGSSSKGRHDMLAPVLHIGNLQENANAAMFNVYAETLRASAVDYAIDNCTRNNRECFSTTDFIYIVQDSYNRPSCLINHPVYATDTVTGKNITTGLVVGVVNWDTIFEDTVPISNTEGIEASVINEKTGEEILFTFKNGVAEESHISKPRSGSVYGSISLPAELHHTSYIIKLVFTNAFENQYRGGYLTTIITVASILALLSLLFIWHDTVMTRQKRNNDLILETKRLFVRYISHEIRTPLNTIHLGLQTLQEEMIELAHSKNKLEDIKNILTDWTNFIIHIDESTEDAIKVVSDLIDFDKINTPGMLNVEKTVFQILPLICDTVSPFKIQGRSKDVIIDDSELLNENLEVINNTHRLRFNSKLPLVVFGDMIKLQQVLHNLISNALKFTPEGGIVKVTATFEEELSTNQKKGRKSVDPAHFNNMRDSTQYEKYVNMPNGYTLCGYIAVKVKDSGAGMPSEQVDQLFQEGVEFDANKLQAGQGSGLGLWLSKGIIHQHFGILRATSEGKGLGSEFILELPVFCPMQVVVPSLNLSNLSRGSNNDTISISSSLTETNKGNKNNAKVTPAPEELVELPEVLSSTRSFSRSLASSPDESILSSHVSSISIKDTKILVVDDTSPTRKVMCRLLKNCGCKTAEVSNGQECLDIISSSMRNASELQFQEYDIVLMDYEMPIMNGPEATAKLRELGCKIPIIGITGNATNEDFDYFLSKGANEVIVKPVCLAQLKEVISRNLAKPEIIPELTSSSCCSPLSIGEVTSPTPLSSITVNLPAATSSSPLSIEEVTSPTPLSSTTVNFPAATSTNRKVLVVDDVASTRKVMCRFLSRCNCDTIQAGDGKECIDIVLASKDHPFDLILMDNFMPIMNGPEATEKLRELGCKIPIVAVTGHVLSEDVEIFLSKGANAVIAKPLDVKKLSGILKEWTKEPTQI